MPPSPAFCSTTRIIFLQCEDRLASGLFCALRYCSASSPMLFAHFSSYCVLFASAERTISLLPTVPSSVGSIDRCVAAETQIAHFPLSNAAARKP